jgi:hypothetical protein
MVVPSTLDGELPSRAFGKRDTPILIGERYLVPDANGREVPGELVSAVLTESTMSVMAIMRLDDGHHISVTMPITQDELNAYRESPETFFGTYEPQTRAKHPVELYEIILSVYRNTSRERLLEFMATHPKNRILPESSTI